LFAFSSTTAENLVRADNGDYALKVLCKNEALSLSKAHLFDCSCGA